MEEPCRFWQDRPVRRFYSKPSVVEVDRDLYNRLSHSGLENNVRKITIPAKSGKGFAVRAGQTCRVVASRGSQVGEVNFWNLHDSRERFFAGKTRAIHQNHLKVYDRIWSGFPYLRPLATITQDSLRDYGIDDDGCSVHDVAGTRCDPYTLKLLTGQMGLKSCHQNLIASVKPWGLQEADIHDVFNIFMCSGVNANDEFVVKSSPAEKGDYIEWLAEIDLLVGLSACPSGDMSTPAGKTVPDNLCHPLEVYIGQPNQAVLDEWLAKRVLF